MCIHESIAKGFDDLMSSVCEDCVEERERIKFLFYAGAKHVFDALVFEANQNTRAQLEARVDLMGKEIEEFEAWVEQKGQEGGVDYHGRTVQ